MGTLRDAYELIEDGTAWTQGAFARTSDGYATHADNPSAVSFCAAGALTKCGLPWLDSPLQPISREMFPEVETYAQVNDELGHAAILQVFEKALAEEGGL